MLDSSALFRGIQSVFDKKIENIAEAAQLLADEYKKYATRAQGSSLQDPVVLLGKEQAKLQQAFLRVMQARLPMAAAATSIGLAVAQFWTAPPVLTAGGGTCKVVIPGGGVSIMLNTNAATSTQAAQSLASSLDVITRTCTVIYPSPVPPGVLV